MNDALFQKLGEVNDEWELPANLVTAGRLCASPIVGLLLVVGSYKSAAVLIGLAWLTDVIDGRVAAITETAEGKLGIWLDPLADKVLHSTAFIFVWLPLVGPWLVAGAIVLMLGQFISYCYLTWRHPVAQELFIQHSNVFGKAETIVAGVATIALLALKVLNINIPQAAPYAAMELVMILATLTTWLYWRNINWRLVNLRQLA